MSPQARFRCWQVVVTLLLMAQGVALAFDSILRRSPTVLPVALLALELPTVALIGLLATTPPDAIRLPTRRSQWIIVAGALLFQSLSITLPYRSPTHAGVALLTVAASVPGVVWLAQRRISPWWIVPLVWNPLWIVLPR